jgi:hypothetical protein
MTDASVHFKSSRTATVYFPLVFLLVFVIWIPTLSTKRRLLPSSVEIKNVTRLRPHPVPVNNSVTFHHETLSDSVQVKDETQLRPNGAAINNSVTFHHKTSPDPVQVKNETQLRPHGAAINNSVTFHHKTLPDSVQVKKATRLPPCRVAVTNSVSFHHETLESIASQLPTKYLNLPGKVCDANSLVFEYHIFAGGNRVHSWVSYFNSTMQGQDVTYLKAKKDPTQKRAIGNLYLHPKLPASGILSPEGYDAYVEATCYCRCFPVPNKRKWPDNINHAEWLSQNDHRTCIFHEGCPAGKLENHPRSVWVSPHHNQYYIPSVLPGYREKPRTINRDNPQLCVIGAPLRRDFSLLAHYFKNHTAGRFRVHIYGLGKYTDSMTPYRNVTKMSEILDYQKFHDQVGRCDAFLALLTKGKNSGYFTGKMKLTGIIPVLLAYKQPAIIHEDLYELYREQLPENVLYETHSDEKSSFADALDRFLDKIQK